MSERNRSCLSTSACATPRLSSSTPSNKWPIDGVSAHWDLFFRRIEPKRAGSVIRKMLLMRARKSAAARPRVDYCAGWHDHPLFIQSWVELIEAALRKDRATSNNRRRSFSPRTACRCDGGAIAVCGAAEELARDRSPTKLGHQRWSLAYQSRSGKPSDPWLEPDIGRPFANCAPGRNRSRRRAHRLCLRPCRSALRPRHRSEENRRRPGIKLSAPAAQRSSDFHPNDGGRD